MALSWIFAEIRLQSEAVICVLQYIQLNGAAEGIHKQVHYLELRAARDMGVLDEYVAWRPSEDEPRDELTTNFYKKLKNA